jgi:hypothetical protein
MDPNRARLVTDCLTVLTIAAGGVMFWPRTSLIGVWLLVALPWIALALALFGGKSFPVMAGKYGGLWFALLTPPVMLLVHTIHGHQLIDWTDILVPSGIVAVAGSALTLVLARGRFDLGLEIALVVIGWVVYSGSVYLIANRELDRGQPEVYTARVEQSHVTRRPSRCRVILSVQGPLLDRDWVTADHELCRGGREQFEACIYRWPGALGAPRFDVRRCEPEFSRR